MRLIEVKKPCHQPILPSSSNFRFEDFAAVEVPSKRSRAACLSAMATQPLGVAKQRALGGACLQALRPTHSAPRLMSGTDSAQMPSRLFRGSSTNGRRPDG